MYTFVSPDVQFDPVNGTESLSWLVYNAEDEYSPDATNVVRCFSEADAHECAYDHMEKYGTEDVIFNG